MEILVINFSLDGMTDGEYQSMCEAEAPAFAAVPGLLNKVWLADRSNGVYGGVYAFENGRAVESFLGSELFAEVGAAPGLTGFSVRRFEVLSTPTAITRGLVGAIA